MSGDRSLKDLTSVKKIWEIAKPYRSRIFYGIIFSLMVSGISGLIAWLVKPVLDIIFVEKQYKYLKILPPAIILLYFVKGLLSFSQTYLMQSAGMKIVRDLRNRLYHTILYLQVNYFHKESSGVLVSRLINDIEIVKHAVPKILSNVSIQLPTIVVLTGVAVYRRWDIAVLTFVLMPFIAFWTRKLGKMSKVKMKRALYTISILAQRVNEAVQGIKIIKVFNQEGERERIFGRENQQYYRQMIKVVRLKEGAKLVTDIVTGLAIAGVLWYGSSLVVKGVITTGDFFSVLTAIFMLFVPVKKLGEAYTKLQEVMAAIERIFQVFETPTEQDGTIKIVEFNKKIRFNGVSFIYPGTERTVLKDINIEIGAGEILALVGESGAGKSTLVDLIPRFYHPVKGSIEIDGIDIENMELKSLRSLVGIVSQDVVLFNDTLRENIAFGQNDAPLEIIKDAARQAHASDFIESLPEGYDTIIGERGVKLSGGQRQRIAIARAILNNPPILILDEATSSLDAVSESLVQQALEVLMKSRTTIIIAHRLSTILNANRIMVLDRGEITDSGTHEELMKKCPVYIKLYDTFSATDNTSGDSQDL